MERDRSELCPDGRRAGDITKGAQSAEPGLWVPGPRDC